MILTYWAYANEGQPENYIALHIWLTVTQQNIAINDLILTDPFSINAKWTVCLQLWQIVASGLNYVSEKELLGFANILWC